jgi:Co/Zn/Cd efflux system component
VDENVKTVALHLAGDAASSVAVFVVGLAVLMLEDKDERSALA